MNKARIVSTNEIVSASTVAVQMFSTDKVIGSDDFSFQKAPESLDAIGVIGSVLEHT